MLDRLREFRRRYVAVDADTSTSQLLTRATWTAVVSGLLFGVLTLIDEGPVEAAIRAPTFTLIMIPVFQAISLLDRQRRRRERDRR